MNHILLGGINTDLKQSILIGSEVFFLCSYGKSLVLKCSFFFSN